MTVTYRVMVAPVDEADPVETIELVEGEASCHAGEEALFIRTNYDQFGGSHDERVIPWRRVIDYRKTEDWERSS